MILNDKYIIFLHKRYFKNKKLIKSLENKGIILIEFTKYIDNIKKKFARNQPTLLFDNNSYPSVNILYIHLVNNNYYNYTIYNQKYLDYHQDILFITSIKLGAKSINYTLQEIDTTITKQYNIKENTIINYIKFFNNYEINNKLDNNIELIPNDINLNNFIYKRKELKVLKLEYNIKNENLSEFIYSILLILLQFNLINNFEKYSNTNFNNYYNIDFYTNIELNNYDQFIKIKNTNNINNIINYIYSLTDSKLLDSYIKNISYKEFESIIKKFNNTNEIINWINDNIINNEEGHELISERDEYIHQIKQINEKLDKDETEIMFEISNIADNNLQLNNELNELKNEMTDLYEQIENYNKDVIKLKDNFKNELLNEIDFDIQVNHILAEITKLKNKCENKSNDIVIINDEINDNNNKINKLNNNIKEIKEKTKIELDNLNTKLYNTYQLIEESNL